MIFSYDLKKSPCILWSCLRCSDRQVALFSCKWMQSLALNQRRLRSFPFNEFPCSLIRKRGFKTTIKLGKISKTDILSENDMQTLRLLFIIFSSCFNGQPIRRQYEWNVANTTAPETLLLSLLSSTTTVYRVKQFYTFFSFSLLFIFQLQLILILQIMQ